MTEAEWLAATDPMPMLEFLKGKSSDRKLRLFACGVCRQLASFVRIDECLFGIAEAECRADGERTKAALKRSRQTLENRGTSLPFSKKTKETYVLFLCTFAMYENDFRNFMGMFSYERIIPNDDDCYKETAPKVPLIARDIFGNPFRPVTLNPTWLTSTVLALAQQMYDSRDFSPMPILADALQDAGCDNEEILNHCRQPGEHCRGCWCVDLLLLKS